MAFEVGGDMLRIRVVDIPSTAAAEEAEALLNTPDAEFYYLDKLITTGLPPEVFGRAVFKLRSKPLSQSEPA